MDRVRNFVQKRMSKAYGLLQVFKERLLPEVQTDVESGPSDPSRPWSIDYPFNEPPKFDSVHVPGTFPNSSDHQIERAETPQPNFTKGPARFILANDGSENCTALLVTESLMTKLCDVFEASLQLENKTGPLEHAKIDAHEAQVSADEAEGSLERAESPESIQELQRGFQQQERLLYKACRRRDKLEDECRHIERSVELSRDHTLWVLNTAMKEANLLRPHTPLCPISAAVDESDDESEHSLQQESTISASEDYTEPPLNESEQLRQAALQEIDKRSQTLDVVQAKFGNQRSLYEENLAEYQQGFENGTFSFSRTEFDCRKLQYGQRLTRALINAEEAYDRAEEHAKAVGAIGSSVHDPSYGHYEESLTDDHMNSYIATKDWSFVHHWLANVPGADMLQGPNTGLIAGYTADGEWDEGQERHDSARGSEDDDWDVPEAEIQDSASAIDYDFNRKNLDRWQQLCAPPLPDASPETWGTWPEDIYMWPIKEIKRRHSFKR